MSSSWTRSGGASTSGSAPLTKLTPYDGLFLRAEHLASLQTYAEQVAAAVGRAGGSGIVHGLTVRQDSQRVVVEPGLAIDGFGLPLVVDQALEIRLEELTHAPTTAVGLGQICLLELVAKDLPTGDGTGYADLYVDPHVTGAVTNRPYATRTATHRLVAPRQLDIAPSTPTDQFRSRVAAAWFATEQATGSLVPTDRLAVNEFSTTDWRTGTLAPATARDSAVPLALLLKAGSSESWDVDMWVARRDRIDTPPLDISHWRFGGRPNAAFLAQVLQFQAHLSTLALSEPAPTTPPHELVASLEEALSAVPQSEGREQIERALTMARQETGSPSGASLLALGIVELPPAGYLPVDPTKPLLGQITAMLGPRVTPRVCVCDPDDVLGAIWASQHRRRIPLDGDVCSEADILVPNAQGTEEEAGLTARLGWVAYVRRSSVRSAPRGVPPAVPSPSEEKRPPRRAANRRRSTPPTPPTPPPPDSSDTATSGPAEQT